jgi:hypothetical protein
MGARGGLLSDSGGGPRAPAWWRLNVDSQLRAAAESIFALDARSLGLMRMGLGAVLAADVLQRARFLTAHYTDSGILPRTAEAALAKPSHWTLLDVSGSSLVCGALFALAGLSAVLLAIGWKTRAVTLVSWVLLTSIQNRNPLVCHSGDEVLRLMLFWSMFLPLGDWFSWDARGRPRASHVYGPGSVCFVLQVLCLFVFLLDHKLLGHAWLEGTAVSDAVSVLQYQRPLGGWIYGHPDLGRVLTYGVLVTQGLTPALLLFPGPRPWPRWGAIGLTVATQVGFGLAFRLGLFPWVTTVWMVGLLPSALWRGQVDSGGTAVIHPWLRRAEWAVGAACIALVALWNVSEAGATFVVGGKARRLGETLLGRAALALRLDQRWSMFAPNPETKDGWFVVAAATADGALWDAVTLLWEPGAPLPRLEAVTEPPESIADAMGPHRWSVYLLDQSLDPKPAALASLASYVCGRRQGFTSVEIVLASFDHLPDRTRTALTTRRLWKERCP